jgi:hypothetical protein
MQYPHDGHQTTLFMGEENVNIMTLNSHYLWDKKMQYLQQQFLNAHYMKVTKCNTHIMTLNPNNFW